MDLKDLTPKSDIIEVTLTHPSTGQVVVNADDTPMTISVYGPYSREYKKVLYANTRDRINKGDQNIDMEELERLNINVLAETTTSWNITYDGVVPELDVELAKTIYENVYWIKSQVDQAVEDALDFTTA